MYISSCRFKILDLKKMHEVFTLLESIILKAHAKLARPELTTGERGNHPRMSRAVGEL